MSDFSSYRDDEKQRRGLLLGAAVGIGAAFAFPVVRRGAATYLLGGIATAGRKFASSMAPLRIASTATELAGLLERGLPRVAQASIAAERATADLAVALSRSGAENAALHARELATSTAFRRFLNSGSKRSLNRAMKNEEVLGIIGRHAAEVAKLEPANALDKILEDQKFRIERALANVNRPTLQEAGSSRVAMAARGEISRLAGRHFENQSRPGFLDWALGKFGVTRVTLGRSGLATTGGELEEARNILLQHAPAGVVDALPVGGLFRAGGKEFDLRGASNVVDRMGRWLKANVQIPISPGMKGISPGQLFPWKRGKIGRTFATAQQFGRDPIGRALFGSPTDRLGKDLFKVGDSFLGVNFGTGTAGVVGELGIDADLYSGLYGAIKRRSMAVNAAQKARSDGLDNWTDFFFNRNWRHTELGEKASLITKFRDPRWAPNIFKKILGGDVSSITEEEIERAGHFLQSQGLPGSVQEKLAAGGTFGNPVLDNHLRNIMTEEGLLNFYRVASQDPNDVLSTLKSARLKSTIQQFQTSPIATLSQGRPSVDFDAIMAGPFGIKGDKTGLDLMRDAVADELVARHGIGTEFLDWTRAQGFKAPDAANTLAYGHGRVLLSRLGSTVGSVADPATIPGVINAINYLRDDAIARTETSAFLRKHVKAWDFFRQPDIETLNTAEVLVPKGRNLAIDLLSNINIALKEGTNPLNAIVDVAKSPAVGQYTSFFTGNQANVTATTIAMEHVPRRLEQYFQTAGLGLPERDLLSGGSILSNLILKRILPVVAAYEGYRYADYKLHQAGLSGPSDIYSNLRSRAGLTRASLTGGNFLGLGSRQLFPGLEKLIPDRTVEQEQEFQTSGYEPVRKGRFWLIGSRTPFFGDKVSYFLPSAVQVTRSHWQEAENADLNTRDYWAHSFIPLPENNFLGPVNWLRDRYWFENKHSVGPNADRPYLVSGELSDPNTAHGPFVNATIGRLLKPQRVLHPEFLPPSLGGTASREQLRALNEAQKQGLDVRGTGLLVGGVGRGGGGLGGGVPTGFGSPGVLGGSGGAATQGSLAVITAGGQLSPLALPVEMNKEQWQSLGQSSIGGQGGSARLSHREIARINRMTKAGIGGLTKVRPSAVTHMFEQHDPFSEEDMDIVNYRSGTIQAISNTTELAGLYGFMFRAGMEQVGLPVEQRGKVIATPQAAYGYNRRLHELGAGSFGEGVTEVFRRFMNKPEQEDLFNPVPNTMPAWLPGSEYFIDFRHGDPYTKVQRGELRLPGEAYERIHHPALLQTRASSLGRSVQEIMRGMLFIDEPLSDYGSEATEVGTAMHRVLQRKWKRMGILVGAEETLHNAHLGISGHYDAILQTESGNTLVDIKTVNDKRFEEAKRHPFAEHVSQINYYLHETGVHQGALIYVNRDKPWEVATQEISYSPGRLRSDIGKVREARSNILDLVSKGTLTRGDLYDPVTRFEILADVAPYSDNYATLRQYLIEKNKGGDLTPEDNKRFQAAKKRVAQQKKTVDVTPYRFKNMELQYKTVTVDKILDPNTISIRGEDNPLRLAGAKSSESRIEQVFGEAPEGMSAAEWQFSKFGIRSGSRIRVAVEGDPERHISRDVLKTQHAVIFRGGRNVNRELIDQGVATEKETDFSSTGVAARFSPTDIMKGKIWETFAHLDNPINNKLLRVRSPLEELERGVVFGKNTGSWTSPIRDFVSPTVSSYISKNNPIWAGIGMGVFASLFMRTKVAKRWAFIGGAAVGGGVSLIRQAIEASTGSVWKPERTRRREELEQYWDILKYVKYRGLAAQEEQLSKKEEGVDIEDMSRELFKEGQTRAKGRNWLEKRKRALILQDKEGNREEISKIQNQIESKQQQQGILKLGTHATRALQYRELYRSTLYGIDPGTTPFLNMFRAFPKYKRELIQGWIEKSNEKERDRIFALLPEQEQRVIGGYLGIDERKIPDRPELREFFKHHPLPNPNWAGWAADVDLEQMRDLAVKSERLDPQESGINNRQIEDAEREIGNVPIPTLRGSSTQIQAKLNEILSGRGIRNLRVNVDVSPHDGDRDQVNVEMRLKQRREQDVIDALQIH